MTKSLLSLFPIVKMAYTFDSDTNMSNNDPLTKCALTL